MSLIKLKKLTRHIIPSAALFLLPLTTVAHGEEGLETATAQTVDIEHVLRSWSVWTAFIAGGIILLVVALALVTKEKTEQFKKILFRSLVVLAVLPTLFFIGSTFYLNAISESGGPVHWHLDFQIHACGERIALAPPDGFLSNKVGTPTFHHHNDDRIHVEGVAIKYENYEIEDFFEVIGGEMSASRVVIPTESGPLTYANGQACPDGQRGEWQAFLYKTEDFAAGDVSLSILADFSHHLMSPETSIPPGDCVILEFGPKDNMTEHTCNFYQLGFDKGELKLIKQPQQLNNNQTVTQKPTQKNTAVGDDSTTDTHNDKNFSLSLKVGGGIFGDSFHFQIIDDETVSLQQGQSDTDIRGTTPQQMQALLDEVKQLDLVNTTSQDYSQQPLKPDQRQYTFETNLNGVDTHIMCAIPLPKEYVNNCQERLKGLVQFINSSFGFAIY